jgi:toxin-antitoxin system PIN domain toxin
VILRDVSVLIHAHWEDSTRHTDYRDWLNQVVNSDMAFGICDLVLSGFLRVVTHPRVFRNPTPLDLAMQFARSLRDHPNAVTLAPGERHWDIFQRLCQEANAKRNLIADAYLAAVTIVSGAEWITADRDYARFSGLRWKHPLD